MNSLVQLAEIGERPKFELFWEIKHALADVSFLGEQVLPFFEAEWILYHSDYDDFPLCDSPVLGGGDVGFVALSPFLLLRFDMSKKCDGDGTLSAIPATDAVKSEFCRRTIGNTFREIISSNEQLLKTWKQSTAFNKRHMQLVNENQYNKIVAKSAQSEIWKINALGYSHQIDD